MSLLDSSGCLSQAGIAAVTAAVPGQIPPEVAAHLAACARCQDRVLSGGAPRPPRKAATAPPSLRRAVLLLALVVLSIFVFFWTLSRLIG